ncbi:MAG: hypothetical protein A3B47_00095 [Candidatus Levybacteria bacterium RIFCSPLOWO2_01_FULL_39_24]|nr:MAG: hypothetical protein A2800_01095 [Candidatus Levybacteria bacterium RIFCSPHIGHO2_01_FULL_40_16]OGH28337.1 MAG: hypothetical protein A3E12_01390 [Candidatus Levybacteria bacterium RIFCSPHIGHO2_12_FULL_39_9]OGH46177.1 MAG: hypothetical protein A3B47_00095 [Candidatus Levybacteria bacterium RIFCSPLOWO2_01_FULL_39_24]
MEIDRRNSAIVRKTVTERGRTVKKTLIDAGVYPDPKSPSPSDEKIQEILNVLRSNERKTPHGKRGQHYSR